MGLMDALNAIQPLTLGGSDNTFIDADTLVDKKGKRFRVQGIDAEEVTKLVQGGNLKQGTAGGAETTDIIHALANEQGFTNMVPLFNPDGTPMMDAFGSRQMTDLRNEAGVSFKTKLLEVGAFDENKHTTDQDRAAIEIAEGQRNRDILEGTHTDSAFDIAAAEIKKAEINAGAGLLGFKKTAVDEVERGNMIQAYMAQEGLDKKDAIAKVNEIYTQTTHIDRTDRNINNEALNPFSDSWDQGWTGVGESAYGVANMFGEVTGNEGIAEWGEQGVERQQAKLGAYGTKILDYTEVDGIGDAFEYLGNNLALSVPYMAITASSAVAGAAAAPVVGTLAGVGAIGLGIPSLMYTGQTWNEMEAVEGGKGKSATVALAAGVVQATLDRLGITAIAGTGVAPKKVLQDAVKTLMRRGMSKKAANDTVVAASRREIAALAGGASQIARQQIKAKAIGMDLLKRFGVGAAGEAVTEAGQEATAYLAATYGSDKVYDWDDLKNRLVSAAIAGGTLGGGLSASGAAYNAGAWADVAARFDPSSADHASTGEMYASEEKTKYGRVASIEELAADAEARATTSPGQTLDMRAEDDKAARGARPISDQIAEKALNVSALWQGATRNIFTPELKNRSRAARVMADMFGGSLQRTFSGSNFESSKHHKVSVYKNKIEEPSSFWKKTIKTSLPKASEKTAASKRAYEQLTAAVDANGTFIPANVVGENVEAVKQLGIQMNELSEQMYQDQLKYNPSLGHLKNYLFKYKSISKKAVKANKPKFIAALVNDGYSRTDAVELTNTILDNAEANDIETAFSVTKGGIVPGSHRQRSLNMSEKADFQDFMEQDIFANISQAAKSAARYTAHRQFIGKNGSVVAKLLDDMQAEGVPKAEVDRVAARMKDYLDAESGNYKRPKSELGKSAIALQKNFMMLTTLAGLPLATISSFVEMALVHKGLTKEQVFGGIETSKEGSDRSEGSLKAMGRELGKTMWQGAQEVGSLAAGEYARVDSSESAGQERIRDLGFYDWDVGAATVTGVTEVNAWQQGVYEKFFKWTGLSGFTNFTRAARASIAQDYISDKADTLFSQRRGGQPTTRETQEAEEALRNLGIDVDQYIDIYEKTLTKLPYTPEEEAFMESTTREATFNWVNEAVALPQAANRPLIYQDPRFALFTQFQGFIATFTANHIPKLWGEYVKRGTPAMKYNAFAVMTTMIALGFASQHLKDLIKYGPDGKGDKTGNNPHLDAAEYLQRGVRSSGLLGTGERVLDQFFPIYEQKTDGVGDWVFKSGTGESPALSNLGRIGKAAGNLIEGDVGNAAKYGTKSAPVIGPFSLLADVIGNAGAKWNFNSGG